MKTLGEAWASLRPQDVFRRSTWQAWVQKPEFPLPIVREARTYTPDKLKADAVAGATVAIVSLPQAIGFALIAGLPPQMVVASLLIGGLFAALFTSSRHLVFGPSNTISLFLAAVIYPAAQESALSPAQIAVLIGFLIGVVQLLAGVLQIGNLTHFISRSVIVGYTTGVAILIIVSQLSNLFGIESIRGVSLFTSLWHTVREVAWERAFNPYALYLGAAALLTILVVTRRKPKWPDGLIVVIVFSVLAWGFQLEAEGVRTVATVGALQPGLPHYSGSPLAAEAVMILPEIANAALAIAILGMLEAISIAKTIASRTGQKINPNQELTGMGTGNIMASFFGAMPGSGSFVRSALNFQSGARTQFSSVIASCIIGVVLLSIVPAANLIPVPVVAAIVIVVAWRMVNREQIRIATHATRSDAVVFFVTLGGVLLLKLDTAVYLGIATSLALFLRKASSPSLVEYHVNDTGSLAELEDKRARNHPQISIIHVEGELFFGAADLFQDEIRRLADDPSVRVLILRMKNARHLDATTVFALFQLHEFLKATGRHILISGFDEDVGGVLRASGLWDRIGENNVFPAEANATMATKRALRRAQQLLGGEVADLRVFYDRRRMPGQESAAQSEELNYEI